MNNGNCKHCKVSFDGDLIYQTFLNMGHSEDEAFYFSSMYAGFSEYGLNNKWNRQIGEHDITTGKLTYYCPDCKGAQND